MAISTESIIDGLREKWREIPATRQDRQFSSDLLSWSDADLLNYWEECRRQTTTLEVRGWYQDLYKDALDGKSIADIGPGVGIDGIFFAQHGAKVTFVEIVEDNLRLLERICRLKRIDAEYYLVDDFFNFHFTTNFDALICIGSLINAPFEFMQKEMSAIAPFLRVGGKVLMLGYPRERFEALGVTSFEEFAKRTDGERTPWIEWYDDTKTRELFGADFQLNWSRNFGRDGIEFNWFDLTKMQGNVAVEKSETPELSLDAKPPETSGEPSIVASQDLPRAAHAEKFHEILQFSEPFRSPAKTLNLRLTEWDMERDDGPILRYIYRNLRPRRHLEFGTWYGAGVLRVLEECDATVFTLNLPEGELKPSGEWAYGTTAPDVETVPQWVESRTTTTPEGGTHTWYRTDARGFIGSKYLERGLGHRVCQILCDSRRWDISDYPPGFFDSAFIDGGHQYDVIENDTAKALQLLRPGGLILWHDYCPDPAVQRQCPSTRDVLAFIQNQYSRLTEQLSDLFWIQPSWLLLGIKK